MCGTATLGAVAVPQHLPGGAQQPRQRLEGSASRRGQAIKKVSDTISSATSRPSVRRRT
ncbi:MAG TPA: hypothetical protein VGC49_09445 [Solirubrobacterales bacterium]